MTYNPEVHHRRSIRLPNYDYRQPGSYFITVCTQNRVCWLGNIADGVMTLKTAGDIVRSVWLSLPARFPMVELDACVVMPNHVHGIIHTHATPSVGAQFIAPSSPITLATPVAKSEHPHQSSPTFHTTPRRVGARAKGATNGVATLGEIVRSMKAISARAIRNACFPEFMWQRNYYEHVIRNEATLTTIREYIASNPLQWDADQLNPNNPSRW